MNVKTEVEKYRKAVGQLYGQDILEASYIAQKKGMIIIGIASREKDGSINLLGTLYPAKINPAALPKMTAQLEFSYQLKVQKQTLINGGIEIAQSEARSQDTESVEVE
jgi:hypothetical protein